MVDSTKEERKNWLIDRNNEYRNGSSTISDSTYDNELKKFCSDFPEDELSKKNIIEKVQDELGKETLPIEMFSLNKINYISEIRTWQKSKNIPDDTEIVLTPKYDSISLCKDELGDGVWTRGDGIVGQARKYHYNYIKSGKKIISKYNPNTDSDSKLYSYGEAIISKKDWIDNFEGKINPSGKLYKNGRNTVAGLFNNKTPQAEILKYVSYIRYGLTDGENNNISKIGQLEVVNTMNEVKVPYLLLKLNDKQLEEKINNQYIEWKKDFEIDGIVIDINDYRLRDLLGREENNNPAFARAFKNPDWCAVETTVVNNIKYSVSKQGFIKPVIEINPVIIGGAEISNVTGNNMKYLIENNIFKGSIIEIIRSGDVIPKHINTISFVEENIINLDKCPCCGSETIWNETNVELCCTNINCPERLLNGLIFFFLIIEIENFGEGEIKKLFNLGYDTPEKILNISYNELNSIEGWAEKSVKSLFKQFNNLKEVGLPLAQLMQALDLFEGKLGKKVAQKIFDNSNDDFAIDNLIKIDGVSDITGNVFIKALNEYNQRYNDFPIKISYITSEVKELVGDKYNNTNICMTGFRDKELEELIINNGGKIASGVSKATTHLLVKDKDSSSSKTDKAKLLTIPILTKEEFLKL